MGQWSANFLRQDGKEVVITGRNEEKLREAGQKLDVATASNVEAVKGADVVLVSVTIESFEDVVKEISPHISPEQIVIDITSIKETPVDAMHKYLKTPRVLGTHPLFGPGAGSVANQNFALTPTNDEERALAAKVSKYLEDREATVTVMTPQEHDELMSVILGLAHFIAIVSADTLLTAGTLKPTEAIGGTTYKILLTLVESVLTEDPELYATLQMNLPKAPAMEKLFSKKAKEWTDLVASKNRQKFVQRMKGLKNKLEQDIPDFGKAYEIMYKLAEKL